VVSNFSSRRSEEGFLGTAHFPEDLVERIPLEAGPTFAASDGLHERLLGMLRPVMSRARATRVELRALDQCFTVEAFREERTTPMYGMEGGGRMLSVASRLQVPPKPVEYKLALPYGRGSIGSLVLTFSQTSYLRDFESQGDALARDVALQVARYDIRDRARRMLDIDVILAGTSAALRNLEFQIEKVGTAPYPVVLEGEFGSEPVAIAAAIHLASYREDRPFVVFDCTYRNPAHFSEEIEAAHRMAAGGTLFLGGVDLLESGPQRDLLRILRQRREVLSQRQLVRPIASTNRALEALTGDGSFCRILKTELDYLRVRIPPLRDRREDIPLLMEELFCARSPEGPPKRLSEAAAAACRRYDWPENESELERTATRLVVMTEDSVVGLLHLRNTVSWVDDEPRVAEIGLLPETGSEFFSDEQALDVNMDVESHAQAPEAALAFAPGLYSEPDPLEVERGAYNVAESAVEQEIEEVGILGDLPIRLVAGNFSNLDCMAIGIQRALRYVGTNYTEDISLSRLARESFMSSSHLSFLLKRSLGVPFKSLLAAVRIERAKQLLGETNPSSITDISLEVGFGDLSHFERTFKRLVGTNPREYRRQQIASRTAPGSNLHAIGDREARPHIARSGG